MAVVAVSIAVLMFIMNYVLVGIISKSSKENS